MKKAWREAERMALREGVESPRAEGGDPHGRLSGFVDGTPVSIVISGSKGEQGRFKQYLKTNIRREVRRLREGVTR